MRVHLKSVEKYWKENKNDIILKINGFLLVFLVATLVTILNVRFDSDYIENLVDEEVKLEQVGENESFITNNTIVESNDVLQYNKSFNIQNLDEDYIKVYPYYQNKNIEDYSYAEVPNNPITVRIDKSLNFVYLNDINYLYTCILNRNDYYLNLSWNTVSILIITKVRTVNANNPQFVDRPPFIWIRARAPSQLNRAVINLNNFLFNI